MNVRTVKLTLPCLAAALLSGCGIVPVAFSAGHMAANGLSYVTTGKSTTDHLVSGLTGDDCALHRALADRPVCDAGPDDVAALHDAGDPLLGRARSVHRTDSRYGGNRSNAWRAVQNVGIMDQHADVFDRADRSITGF